MPEIRTVQITPPQPCGMLDPTRSGRICGQPASMATVEAAPVTVGGPAGYLLCLPICSRCAATAPKLATEGADLVLATIAFKLPTVPHPAVLEAAANVLTEQVERMQRDATILRERAAEIARDN